MVPDKVHRHKGVSRLTLHTAAILAFVGGGGRRAIPVSHKGHRQFRDRLRTEERICGLYCHDVFAWVPRKRPYGTYNLGSISFMDEGRVLRIEKRLGVT